MIRKLLIALLMALPVVLAAQLAKPDGTIATDATTSSLTLSKTLTLTADHTGETLPAQLETYYTIEGNHALSQSSFAMSGATNILDYYNAGTGNGISGHTTFIYQEDGTLSGSNVYTGTFGQWTGAFTYGGSTPRLIGTFATASNYGGTTGTLAAFWAGTPDSPVGTITGHSVAYFNENWGAGGFSWYSEGGTLHAETGHANNVGVEVIAAASQAVDLQRWLASDESTVLAKVDKDGKLTAADVMVSGISTRHLRGTSASLGGSALLAGACATNATTVTGATTSMAVAVSPVTYPGAGATWDGYVSGADTVTTRVCGIIGLTPTASTYNIAVIP